MHHHKSRHLLWLLGIVFLALATSGCEGIPTVIGINCIEEQPDGSILAMEGFRTFVSRDGGLSWQLYQPPDHSSYLAYCHGTVPSDDAWIFNDRSNPAVAYRFTPGVSIERSEDNSATWRREIDLSGIEARMVYYIRFRHDGVLYWAGPSDALVHTQTGNLVVAMSYEGTLLRTPQGEWSWVGVDRYQHVDMRNLAISIPLIWGELIMGLAFAVVTISTMTLFSKRKSFLLVIEGIVLIYVVGPFIGYLLLAVVSYLPLEGAHVFEWAFIALTSVLPFLIGLVVARMTHQEQISVFVCVVAGWSYLIPSGLLMCIDLKDLGIISEAPLMLSAPIAIVGLIVTAIVARKLHRTSRDRLMPTLAFGSIPFFIFAGVYFLWAIGEIAFYQTATLWAWGPSLVNLVVGIWVLRHLPSSGQPSDRPVDRSALPEPPA